MAAPCTLDTLRLRCLITQDTSSRGNRACYRASPFPLSFLFCLSISSVSFSFFLSKTPLFPSLPSDVDGRLRSVGRIGRGEEKGKGIGVEIFPTSFPYFFFFFFFSFRELLKGRRWPRHGG